MPFSEKLKQLRQREHLTQEDLAQQLHVSRKTVSGWENRRSLPDNDMFEIIAQLFEVSVSSLKDDFTDEVISNNLFKNDKQRRLVQGLIIIQISFILITYLSFLQIINLHYHLIVLMLTTVVLAKFVQKMIPSDYQLEFLKDKHRNYIILGLINSVIAHFISGITSFTSPDYLLYPRYSLSGFIFGNIFYVVLLSVAINYVRQYFKLKKLTQC